MADTGRFPDKDTGVRLPHQGPRDVSRTHEAEYMEATPNLSEIQYLALANAGRTIYVGSTAASLPLTVPEGTTHIHVTAGTAPGY